MQIEAIIPMQATKWLKNCLIYAFRPSFWRFKGYVWKATLAFVCMLVRVTIFWSSENRRLEAGWQHGADKGHPQNEHRLQEAKAESLTFLAI